MINICCCLRLISKQISELFQTRGFNGYTGVIGYADLNMILSTTYDKYLLLFTTKKVSLVLIKKVNYFAESEFRSFELSYVNVLLFIYIYKVVCVCVCVCVCVTTSPTR